MALTTVRSTGIGSLPAISGENLTTLNASNISSGTLNSARFSGGKVLQVINSVSSTEVVVSNNTPVDSGLTATITPSSSSNKILVLKGGALVEEGNHKELRLKKGLYFQLSELQEKGFASF